MKKSNRYLLIPVALLSVALVSACGSNGSKNEDITLRVAYNQWVGSAGLFIADSKGYFKDAGIKVKLIEFASPTEATQALLSDNVDIALTTLDTAVMVKSNEQSKNLKVFSLTDLSSGADGIVASKDIKSVADLKGKTVAATVGAVNHFLLDHALKQAGLAESDVNLSNVSPEQTGPLFMSGKVDAAVTWEPYLSQAMAKGGNLLFSTKEAPDLIIDGIVAPEDLIKNHGSELRKFVDAIDKGVSFYYSDTDEAAAMVGEKLDAGAGDVKSMMDGVKLIPASEVKTKMTDDLSALEQHAQDFSAFFLDKKLIKNGIKAPDLFDNFLYQ